MTNADRIRQMSDEELRKVVGHYVCWFQRDLYYGDCPDSYGFGKCNECVLDWLKQEVNNE